MHNWSVIVQLKKQKKKSYVGQIIITVVSM